MPAPPREHSYPVYRSTRLTKAEQERDHLKGQIQKLADFILSISPSGIPGDSGGAVDVAITYLKEAGAVVRRLERERDELWQQRDKLQDDKTKLWTLASGRNYEIGILERERDMLRDALWHTELAICRFKSSLRLIPLIAR